MDVASPSCDRHLPCTGVSLLLSQTFSQTTLNFSPPIQHRLEIFISLRLHFFLTPLRSPWWLVRKDRIEDAKRSLLRLTSLNRETHFEADETVAMIAHTTALEEQITTGAKYADCFKGTDLRRTEIVCMVWAIQNLSGSSFSGYANYVSTLLSLLGE